MTMKSLYRCHALFALCCGWFLWSLPVAAAETPWVSTVRSSGQHPIEVARFGQGAQNVLIVGSLFGNEPESLELLDAASMLSREYPPPEPITLLFVRTLNPDGVAEHVHTNSNGVDLNRNFPSRYFTTVPNRLTGPQPASEVETQYMLRIFQEYQPVRVVHVRSGFGEHPFVTVNRAWLANGETPQLPERIGMGFFDQSYKAGSLEEYADHELKTSVATIVLAARGGKQMNAGELLRFVTGNLTTSPQERSLARQNPQAGSARTPSGPGSTHGVEARPAADGTRKEVEFLPTPPEYKTTSRPGQTNDPRYFELPAPPH